MFYKLTLTEAVASCVAINMTLLTPEDLSTLPQYSNLLQSNIASILDIGTVSFKQYDI
jgi:hypothetical protein